ncbi:MAG TPA: glycosyltransferase [Thermoanaerobaculia bacterium]|nr:glycosyltransferase [Thermoanaerobaculia bacterium]
MSEARVSVIVPAYNYGRFLPEALDSVLAQTFTAWECVIVDDGSTDDTAAVAQRHVARDARFRYLRQDNRGPSAARNHGIRESWGEYLQFLDADDKLAPGKLALHARFLDEHPDVDLVYGLSTFFRTEEPEKALYSLHGHLSRPLMQKVTGNAEALLKLQEFNITPPAAMFLRRSVIDRAGYFNEASRGCEDWDYWLRCAIAGCEIRYLESGEAVAFMRTHSASASRSSERMMRGLIHSASTFHEMPAGKQWAGATLPAVYEMAMGIDAVEHGRKREGIHRIADAALSAHSSFTRWRWRMYSIAAAVLPRPAFLWLVMLPMPERGLELLRRLQRSRR